MHFLIICLWLILSVELATAAEGETWLENVITDFSNDNAPHSGVAGKSFTVQNLKLELDKINDIGLLFVLDENHNIQFAGSCESTATIGGSTELELNPFLKKGHNLLIFALWNKEGKNLDLKLWKKSFLDGFSYEYTITGDGTRLYHLEGDKSGGAGVTYWNAFEIVKSGSNLTIKAAPTSTLGRLKAAMLAASQNQPLINTEPKLADIAANLAVQIATN